MARVEEHEWPSIVCPTCSAGYLAFETPTRVESVRSRRAQGHEDWDPYWISGTFTSSAICRNEKCEESLLLSGDYSVEVADDGLEQYVDVYKVRYVNPALSIMDFPEGTPEEVVEGVKRAAVLLFLDAPSAANALRAAVERFLTLQGVPKEASKRFISAHQRITLWRDGTGRADVANCFLAVKWIGNDGSHEVSDLTVDQVLEGVEILEYAFRLLFDRTGQRIEAAAAAINAARGLPPTSP